MEYMHGIACCFNFHPQHFPPSTSSEFKTRARVFPVCLQRVARVCCLLTGCSRDWQSAVVMRFVWDIRGQHVEE